MAGLWILLATGGGSILQGLGWVPLATNVVNGALNWF